MKPFRTSIAFVFLLYLSGLMAQKKPVDYVNPFIGTSNFGTTNPGPIAVRGMANVSPFNVAGSQNLPLEKDSRWLSTPYVHEQRIITLTLGTGIGASFLERGVPLFKGEDVPENGCLWDKKFKNGIADAYFSTRWFVQRFYELTGRKVSGIRELVASKHGSIPDIFQEYVQNMTAFLSPYIKKFKPSTILLGGNIAKASDYFLEDLNTALAGLNVKVVVSTIGEEAAIMGSAIIQYRFLGTSQRQPIMLFIPTSEIMG